MPGRPPAVFPAIKGSDCCVCRHSSTQRKKFACKLGLPMIQPCDKFRDSRKPSTIPLEQPK